MILFHGSYKKVENPKLGLSRKSLDFGSGFYTTVNKEQAVDFARKVAIRKKQEIQCVSVYDFNEEAANLVLNILRFMNPDRFWLDFVHQNRHGVCTEKPHDLVIGAVANDDVYATVILYEQGILNVEQTIESLKIKKLYSQYVFKTEKSLLYLKFIECFDPGVK